MKNKRFDCVQMTRKIRDQLYEKHKDLSLEEFTQVLIAEAHKSRFWKNHKKETIKQS